MAACSTCGTKIGWTMTLCSDCAKAQQDQRAAESSEFLANEMPSLLEVLNRVGESPNVIHPNAFDVLPRDTTYLAIYSSSVFLTERGILTFNFALTTGRLKTSETIPVATITSLELKPPTSAAPGVHTLKLIRAGNEDTQFSNLGSDAIQDFIAKTQNAMAGVSAPAPAPTAGKSNAAERMKSLGDLRDQGLISDAEYEEKRAAILSDL